MKLSPITASKLDPKDIFFDSLREDYLDFDLWFAKISKEERKCWSYQENGILKALMIIKEENEPIATTIPLPKSRRLKICTLKVDMAGSKMGELLLKIAFDYCMENKIPEVYLTHYAKENDALPALLEEFEFARFEHSQNQNKRGEHELVYVKSFVPSEDGKKNLSAIAFARKYYPLFRDFENVKKFLVPIRPEYHNRLFPSYERSQRYITDYTATSFGNAIRKAYLCHSGTTKISPGDILVFYRSDDEKAVGCLGIVEKTLRTQKIQEIKSFVSNRSVYSDNEIMEMTKKPVLAILFRHHLNLPAKLNLSQLSRFGVIKTAPQSITEINNKQYAELKVGCRIDEHIAIS